MSIAGTTAALRAYSPPRERAALEARLLGLAAAGLDETCATYFDLRPPSLRSPLHARTTYLLAESLVGRGPALPLPFDTVVPSRWRLLVCAGAGRLTDVGLVLMPSSAAAPESLLNRVCAVLADPQELCEGGHQVAAQLLWRLGAKQSLFDLCGVAPTTDLVALVREGPRPAEAAAISLMRDGTSDALEEASITRAADRTLTISERVRLIRFVLVRRGKAPCGRRPAEACL